MTRTLKRLESAWKRLVMRTLSGVLRGSGASGEAPDWDAHPYRVLYLRYDRIGDMIMATGLIRAIARSHPTIELDVLASPLNASVLDGNPHVRSVLLFDRRRASSFRRVLAVLRRRRYDVVIDGMVLTPSVTTLLLMLATGARHRIGIGGRSNDFIYTLPVAPALPEAHQIAQSAATARPFGVDVATTDWHPELFLTPSEIGAAEERWGSRTAAEPRPTRLLVNVSVMLAHRVWPEDRFVALLRHTRDRWPELRTLIVGSPGDRARVSRIAGAAGADAVDTPRLRDALALVGTADAVFTPDTSIAHAASAFRKPAVVMLVAGSGRFAPYHAIGHALFSDGPTLDSLPLAPVISALDELLSRAQPRTSGTAAG
ncbi:MAG: glycosyltransferase family 9 protein [Gemmatimonadota bacterium]|nr:glycosyltransferase family 9 protein [Gemmatimonadota bacterium]